ncbi:SDR family NAD(P)-dependent oxidoreductase [Bacillus sp. AFS031507]|uniref:SDR family NAD(P)-dependent oxidoreductase n=1 Tax=Bacillus sp. AFS031507 TaxID=2033496 RepID=UPI000BFCD298|nr:SDR family oxidoreductase [Bacillus sp. AFS031507]PGY12966.1 short-chain dehydrogenase [Bacillus sp. AFS031507]
MRLKDKVAVITGGGSGIGRATCLKFVEEGAKVVVADFNETAGNETVEMLIEIGGDAVFKKVDVTDFQQVEDMINFTVETFGRIDTIFNNAGIAFGKPLLELNPETYEKIIKVNQDGVYYGITLAGRKMRELGIQGTIINSSSVFGFLANAYTFSYNASKGAVRLMTQTAALELAPYGIRVVGVAPGVVDTPIYDPVRAIGREDEFTHKQMTKAFTPPSHIANVVAFLASEEALAINGSTILADDGYASFK